MARNDILELKKMVEALLRSDGLVEWIGGYVYGRTSQDDPFVILYPASGVLKEKACRVYAHAFRKLPDFIPTDNVPADTENNPSKGQAQRAGIYHECPRFKIVMHLGKETQMGREKRFGDVLYIPPAQAAATRPATRPAGLEGGSESTPAGNGAKSGPKPTQGQGQDDDDARTHWRVEAATAGDPFLFDTAIVKLEPWFKDSDNVAKFRETLFGEWEASRTGAYVVAMEAYAGQRKRLNGSTPARQAHRAAKQAAMKAYRQALNS